jgi:hypothetical protein
MNTEEHRQLRRLKGGWENTNMYLKEIEREDVDWIHQHKNWDQRRAVLNTLLNYLAP